jgi:YggT family protein
MDGFLQDVGSLLISVVFGLYIFMLLLRLIFQILRADFYNPMSQAIVKITNPPLLPLRKIIPGLWGIDMASVLLIIVLQVAEIWLLLWLKGHAVPVVALVLISVGYLLKSVLWIFLGAIFIRILLSWITPYGAGQNPVVGLVYSVSEPLLRPARRLLPQMGGLDLSPMLVVVGLYILLMAVNRLFGV